MFTVIGGLLHLGQLLLGLNLNLPWIRTPTGGGGRAVTGPPREGGGLQKHVHIFVQEGTFSRP